MAFCPSCGKRNAEDAQFCSACGSPLKGEGETEARERRKTVTIVFCDLTGSTSLGERLDSESLRQVMRRYFATMRSALESHGGTVEKFIGDAVMAVFGVPTLHEDDALRAVRAAADMKAGLAELNTELRRRWDTELRTRTGVNTGEVVAGDPSQGESFVIGDAVNVAARLEQSAAAGEVLLGETTYSLVRDAVRAEAVGPLEVKGKSAPLRAYRLLEVAAQAPGVARRLDAPIVGREQELARLEEGFERAVRDRTCELITVLGPAGVGKSRLAQELVARVSARAGSLQGRCLPYGEGITFWPVSEVIRQAAGIGHSESAEEANAMIRGLFPEGAVEGRNARHLASAVGLSAEASTPEEIFFATRTLFECLARQRPLVVVFDDLHWAESTFIDLVEYLESYSRDQPVFLLLLARPELREAHPQFVESRIPTTVVLEPLGEDDSELLVEKLLGEARLADDVSQRITQAAEGNPLFVEELLRMLVDDGLLERQNGSWRAVGDLSQISMPPTIHALLGARLDRLGAKERGVIEPAAVVGQEFSRGAIAELGPKPLGQNIDTQLTALTEKGLIEPGGTMFVGEEAFRFGHMLIRDVAYAGLLKEARAELHEGFGGWLEEKAGKRVTEYEEILGYHFEQAFRYREELGPLDERTTTLGRRAAERLGGAAGRALTRGDMPAAANLLERATAVLPPGEPGRRGLQLELGTALCQLGELARAEALLAETAAAATAAADERVAVRALLERSYWRLAMGSEGSTDDVRRAAETAVPVLERAGDEGGLARALGHLAFVDSVACRWGMAAASLERGLVHARRAGDAVQETELLWQLTGALQYGPFPVDDGIRRLREILSTGEGGGSAARLSGQTVAVLEATGLAGLQAMRGDFDEARTIAAHAKAILEELGQAFKLAELGQVFGWIELLAGLPADAEAELRRSYELLEEIGEKGYLSTTAAFLAESVYQQGRFDEADQLSQVAERWAVPDDVVSQVLWRATRGKVLVQHESVIPGEALVREAISRAARTDDLNLHADKLMDLAEVLRLTGRADEAGPVTAEALELYEAKGNLVASRKAAAFLTQA